MKGLQEFFSAYESLTTTGAIWSAVFLLTNLLWEKRERWTAEETKSLSYVYGTP